MTRHSRSPATEKKVAWAQVAVPVVTSGLMPLLDPQTASTVSILLAAPGLLIGANATGLIPADALGAMPGGDILDAHRQPLLISAVATGTAAATATLSGWTGIDSLAAGWMALPSVAGIVSLAWWSSIGYTGFLLRRVLRAPKHGHHLAQQTAAPADSAAEEVLRRWSRYISGPEGVHPGQNLELFALGAEAWRGVIHSKPGQPVTVSADAVSGAYAVPVEQVRITAGPHASAQNILVHMVAPTGEQAQYSSLEALWARRVARPNGCMPGTHLEGAVHDPATGGVAAWIIADDNTDAITIPDAYRIAGALRTTTLLSVVEPTNNPRKARLRLMVRSPLETGRPLPGPAALLANRNGYVDLGTGISGRPARIQLYDTKGGARHVLIAGVTGSGKGGVLQLLALSYHVNGVAIIYADPKGSSNPDVEDMAAYAGCGIDGAMGALRVGYAVLQHRIEQSHRLRMKNFTPGPGLPYVAVVLDEFAQLLGDKAEHRAEAAFIITAIAEQGRSLGMCLVLCGQILNLDKMGGDTAIRDNVFYGGALILLRSDSAQKHRVDLPDAFEGVDPSKIPASWKGDDDTLIHDPTVPENDPTRTFGVGYTVGPDERAEMMRAWILESAAGHFDPDRITIPGDWDGWEDRELAASIPVGPAADDGKDGEGSGSTWTPAPAPSLAKEPTAQEKIVTVLDERRDPLGEDVGYLHLDQIAQMTGVARKTVENTLSRLAKDGTILRNPDAAGEYGLPAAAGVSAGAE